MSSTVLDVYKDCLNQDILEGDCCIFAYDKHNLKFGIVVESRTKVKVAYSVLLADKTRTTRITWVSRGAVSIVKEDWLFQLLDADTLHAMATIKQEVMQEVEKVRKRKERKKIKVEAMQDEQSG